jgi:hypothetical protein
VLSLGDGDAGTTSYGIEATNGGTVNITDTDPFQGPGTHSSTMLRYGADECEPAELLHDLHDAPHHGSRTAKPVAAVDGSALLRRGILCENSGAAIETQKSPRASGPAGGTRGNRVTGLGADLGAWRRERAQRLRKEADAGLVDHPVQRAPVASPEGDEIGVRPTRRNASDFFDWLSTNNGAQRQLDGSFGLSPFLIKPPDW